MPRQARSMDRVEDARMEPRVEHSKLAQGLKSVVSKEVLSASRATYRCFFCLGSWDWGASLEVAAWMASGAAWRQELVWAALTETV